MAVPNNKFSFLFNQLLDKYESIKHHQRQLNFQKNNSFYLLA